MARELAVLYPDVYTELNFKTPLELLVATILSAQTTDKRVNLVTPTLFARYPTAADYAGADREELEKIIQSTGFYHAKSTSLMGLGQALCERFGGEVPGRLKDLVTKPGPLRCPGAASRPRPSRPLHGCSGWPTRPGRWRSRRRSRRPSPAAGRRPCWSCSATARKGPTCCSSSAATSFGCTRASRPFP